MSDGFFLAVGILFAGVGCLLSASTMIAALTCTGKVDAEITETKKRKSVWRGRTILYFQPVCTYEWGGKEYKAEAHFEVTNEKQYKVGDRIQLKIHPSRPDRYFYPREAAILIPGLIILAIGVVLIFVYFL